MSSQQAEEGFSVCLCVVKYTHLAQNGHKHCKTTLKVPMDFQPQKFSKVTLINMKSEPKNHYMSEKHLQTHSWSTQTFHELSVTYVLMLPRCVVDRGSGYIWAECNTGPCLELNTVKFSVAICYLRRWLEGFQYSFVLGNISVVFRMGTNITKRPCSYLTNIPPFKPVQRFKLQVFIFVVKCEWGLRVQGDL